MPTVSVIIPTYNRPEMLAHAIDSVLKQTYQDFEIIVVNDCGSPVDAVLEKHAHDPRIVYLNHDVNKGTAAAKNTGIRSATGTYIAYLDDDDIFYPHHLETLVKHLEAGTDPIVYSDAYCSFRTDECGAIKEIRKELIYSEDFDHDAIYVRNFIPVCCVLHRKDCCDVAGMFDESLRVYEDWDLWLRFSQHFTFSHIKEITCEYISRGKGTSLLNSNVLSKVEAHCRIINKNKVIISQSPKKSELCITALLDIASGQQACLTGEYDWRNKIMGSFPYRLFRLLKSPFLDHR